MKIDLKMNLVYHQKGDSYRLITTGVCFHKRNRIKIQLISQICFVWHRFTHIHLGKHYADHWISILQYLTSIPLLTINFYNRCLLSGLITERPCSLSLLQNHLRCVSNMSKSFSKAPQPERFNWAGSHTHTSAGWDGPSTSMVIRPFLSTSTVPYVSMTAKPHQRRQHQQLWRRQRRSPFRQRSQASSHSFTHRRNDQRIKTAPTPQSYPTRYAFRR